MMNSTAYGIDHIAENQQDNYLTANEQVDKSLELIAGHATINFTADADYTINADPDVGQSRILSYQMTDTGLVLTTARNVVLPAISRIVRFDNQTAQMLTVKTPAGAGVAVKAGSKAMLFCDGIDVIYMLDAITNLVENNLTIGPSGGVGSDSFKLLLVDGDGAKLEIYLQGSSDNAQIRSPSSFDFVSKDITTSSVTFKAYKQAVSNRPAGVLYRIYGGGIGNEYAGIQHNGFSAVFEAGVGHIELRPETTAKEVRAKGKLVINSGTAINKHLSATTIWDPLSTAAGAYTSTTVTVTGAAIGDTVSVGFSQAVPAGALLVGAVTAIGTVTVTLMNNTGGVLDLLSGTLRADVWQH